MSLTTALRCVLTTLTPASSSPAHSPAADSPGPSTASSPARQKTEITVFFPAAILLHLLGIRGNHFVDDLLDAPTYRVDCCGRLLLHRPPGSPCRARSTGRKGPSASCRRLRRSPPDRPTSATPFIEIGDCSISSPFAFSRPINSLCTRFATRLGFFAAFAAASN